MSENETRFPHRSAGDIIRIEPRRASRIVIVVAVGATLLLAACVQPVGPARTYDDYEKKAKTTAESALSAVSTAAYAVQLAEDDDAFPPYLSVLVSEAENDAGNAQGTFDGIQPPGKRADDLREELDTLLDEATGTLEDLRIAARRADFDEMASYGKALARSADDLERFVEDHE